MTAGEPASTSATAAAFAAWRASRRSRVLIDRWPSHASNGPGVFPVLLRQRWSRANRSSSVVLTWPSSRSLCPVSALVSLPTVRSAPSSSGRWPSGVAVVLSTATIAPRRVRRAGDGGDVADVEQRVAGRLQEHQPDAVQAAAGGHRLDLRRRHVVDPDAEPLQLVAGQQPGRVVAVRRQDDAVAGADAGEHGGADRGHPGGEGQAAAAVERADRGLEVAQRRVLGARVGVGAAGARRQVAEVERRREHRRGPQRRTGDGARPRRPAPTGCRRPRSALTPASPRAT